VSASRRAAAGPAIPNALEPILRSTRERVQRSTRALPLAELQAQESARPVPHSAQQRFRDALARPGLSVIAEFKRRSPSAGVLRAGGSVADAVLAYERGGASALSVLTEEAHFDGSLEDLRAARASTALPILRKDFIVDAYQLHEARLAGADAVLLIVAALDDRELASLHAQALELGLDALVEVHDGAELARTLELGPSLVGVNNRDLRDFSVDVRRTFTLLPDIPAGVTVVSESGIGEARQLRELAQAGVDAVLIGESLMRAGDPELALRALLEGANAR
jgi:indole-3-glycerol phosphate synthase